SSIFLIARRRTRSDGSESATFSNTSWSSPSSSRTASARTSTSLCFHRGRKTSKSPMLSSGYVEANLLRAAPGGKPSNLSGCAALTHRLPRELVSFRIFESIAEIPEAAWDALHSGQAPFVTHAWLHALEASGCASPERGWSPAHLTLWENDQLVAAAP